MQNVKINEQLARRVLKVVDAGLVSGLGKPVPGQMCVEAAVCYAQGLPHSDRPTCVGAAVRAFKIKLNDARWSSNTARTQGMRKLAVAQLGSDQIDQRVFAKLISEQCIRQVVPIALRAAASTNPKYADKLEAAAIRCEQEGTAGAARAANSVARDADAYAAAYAADVAYAAAAYVAYAVTAAYAAADADAARDKVLNVVAEIGLQALIKLQSPGCAFLNLTM